MEALAQIDLLEGEPATDSRSTVATVPRRKKYKSGVRTSLDRISNRKAMSDQKQKRKGIISYLFVPDFVGLLPFRKGKEIDSVQVRNW